MGRLLCDRPVEPGTKGQGWSLDIYRSSAPKIFAPKGLEDSAQVLTLGTDHPERRVLKGRQIGVLTRRK